MSAPLATQDLEAFRAHVASLIAPRPEAPVLELELWRLGELTNGAVPSIIGRGNVVEHAMWRSLAGWIADPENVEPGTTVRLIGAAGVTYWIGRDMTRSDPYAVRWRNVDRLEFRVRGEGPKPVLKRDMDTKGGPEQDFALFQVGAPRKAAGNAAKRWRVKAERVRCLSIVGWAFDGSCPVPLTEEEQAQIIEEHGKRWGVGEQSHEIDLLCSGLELIDCEAKNLPGDWWRALGTATLADGAYPSAMDPEIDGATDWCEGIVERDCVLDGAWRSFSGCQGSVRFVDVMGRVSRNVLNQDHDDEATGGRLGPRNRAYDDVLCEGRPKAFSATFGGTGSDPEDVTRDLLVRGWEGESGGINIRRADGVVLERVEGKLSVDADVAGAFVINGFAHNVTGKDCRFESSVEGKPAMNIEGHAGSRPGMLEFHDLVVSAPAGTPAIRNLGAAMFGVFGLADESAIEPETRPLIRWEPQVETDRLVAYVLGTPRAVTMEGASPRDVAPHADLVGAGFQPFVVERGGFLTTNVRVRQEEPELPPLTLTVTSPTHGDGPLWRVPVGGGGIELVATTGDPELDEEIVWATETHEVGSGPRILRPTGMAGTYYLQAGVTREADGVEASWEGTIEVVAGEQPVVVESEAGGIPLPTWATWGDKWNPDLFGPAFSLDMLEKFGRGIVRPTLPLPDPRKKGPQRHFPEREALLRRARALEPAVVYLRGGNPLSEHDDLFEEEGQLDNVMTPVEGDWHELAARFEVASQYAEEQFPGLWPPTGRNVILWNDERPHHRVRPASTGLNMMPEGFDTARDINTAWEDGWNTFRYGYGGVDVAAYRTHGENSYKPPGERGGRSTGWLPKEGDNSLVGTPLHGTILSGGLQEVSLEFYIGRDGQADHISSPHIRLAAAYAALAERTREVGSVDVAMSVWDGQARGPGWTPEEYASRWMFAAWQLRPSCIHEFRGAKATLAQFRERSEALLRAVELVHENAILRRFWQRGELISTSPFAPIKEMDAETIPGVTDEGGSGRRWFLLPSSGNPAARSLSAEVPVQALALFDPEEADFLVVSRGTYGKDAHVWLDGHGYDVDATPEGQYTILGEDSTIRLNMAPKELSGSVEPPEPEQSRLTRAGYEQLIQSDIAWLDQQPQSMEKQHIRLVLERSVELEYPAKESEES